MNTMELVNASAGSGKTYNLTARVVEALKKGIDPESLMAMTFTNRAAAELCERIRVQLLKSGQPEKANRINDGFIGTVNSICARLLKEYALEAGLSPALEIMPEEDSVSIFRISIERVVNQYAEQIEPAARRLEINGGNSGYQAAADWRDQVKQIVDLARSNQITPEQLEACSRYSWESLRDVFGAAAAKDLDQALQAALTLAINNLDQRGTLTKTTQKALETLKTVSRRLARNQQTWSDWSRLAKLAAAKDGQDSIEPVCAIADRVLRHPQFQADVRQVIEGAFQCAIGALRDYDDYKLKHGLMDFTDQETRVLEMARDNEPFRASIRDRVRVLMVDEFQDTSPIQLALFLALHERVGRSVLVGDPKQAIYGFRGTDPQLMEDVIATIGQSSVLDCSWRSRENLIAFTNALFAAVFHKMGQDKVCLKVPAERKVQAKGGSLEAWHLSARNNAEETTAIAGGVQDLIKRIPGITPGYIAILCRTNKKCVEIATCLESLGIRASVGQGLLLDTRECRLALAALRYMNNQYNSLALAEIRQLTEPNESKEAWLADLMSNPQETRQKWSADPLMAPIHEGREKIKYWTPLEALEQAISRIGLLRTIKAWPNPNLARSNLDALRGACHQYVDQCAAHRSAATVDGFVTWLKAAETEQAQGSGALTVNVLTYHGAKGLEWPWVVLTDLDASPREAVFGVNLEAAPQFDMANPLAGRKIRYWPWPFAAQKTYPQLDDRIDRLPLKQTAQDKAAYEEQRLLYVGMTRAKDGLVMAIRKTTNKQGVRLQTGWLDALTDASGESVIRWNTGSGSQLVQVGPAQIPINICEYDPETTEGPGVMVKEAEYLPALPQTVAIHPVARLSPSSLSDAAGMETGRWAMIANFNARVRIYGKPEMDNLGSAVHAYLAVDDVGLTDTAKLALARDILDRWGLLDAMDPADIVAAGQRLAEFIRQRYPEHKVYREWPMTLRNDKGQLLQGWIDLLLETPDGYVIIDHKDYPGPDAEERVKKYIPQMATYQSAVEQATGRPVIETLLHMPISGQILRLQ
ncbi:MAG: UvrD-helicase domain-containing protein [Bacillota bacterium]|nr:UvrD-helicase domain-containing protein [Bacillota bacterium]